MHTRRRQRRDRLTTAAAAGLLLGLAAACGGGNTGDTGDAASAAPAASGTAGTAATSGAPSTPVASATPSPGRKGAASPSSGGGAPITLSFAGDVHFEGSSRAALSGGLAAITPALSAADLTVVNLETAVSTGGTRSTGKQFTFRAPPAAFTVLKAAGVDVVTMANNHALDYGTSALADSLAASKAAGLPVVGAGPDEDAAFAPHISVVKGRRVAVIGATQVLDANLATAWTAGPGKPGLASAKDEPRLVQAVQEARKQADVVVVDLHWGTETVSCPTDSQESLAKALSAAGADVVVGSHAHVLLGGGFLGRTYVHYGLGNFVFYARTPVTQATGVLTLTVQGRAVTKADWLPARIGGGVPAPLTGTAATAALGTWNGLRSCTGLSASPS